MNAPHLVALFRVGARLRTGSLSVVDVGRVLMSIVVSHGHANVWDFTRQQMRGDGAACGSGHPGCLLPPVGEFGDLTWTHGDDSAVSAVGEPCSAWWQGPGWGEEQLGSDEPGGGDLRLR